MRTALHALGAEAKVYVPGSVSGLDGMESNPKSIDYNGWEGALTTNVILWPKPYTIVMNRTAFDALRSEQQDILRDAGREALAPELAEIAHDAAAALSAACTQGKLSFVSASPADIRGLREAVRPVYDELGSDPETQELIDDITAMRSGELRAASALAPCRRAGRGNEKTGGAALEGRWKLTFTRDDLIAVGVPKTSIAKKAPQIARLIVEFANGRYRVIVGGSVVVRGTYTVRGDVLSLVFDAPVPAGYFAGQVYRQRWNVYRESLTFTRVAGSDFDGVLLTNPLTRVR
jgi:hypothetical protein